MSISVTPSQTRPQPSNENHAAGHRHRRLKRKIATADKVEICNIPGVAKIILSEKTQKILSCFVGEHITAENPWTEIQRENLEYDIDTREDTCELVPFRDKIVKYSREEVLIGYIPDETREYDEFYICLTEAAADKVNEIIKKSKEALEERLKGSIIKYGKKWWSRGSENEIVSIIQNRLVLEVELEAEYPLFGGHSYRLRCCIANDTSNSYVELLPLRLSFTNVMRKRMPAAIQAASQVTTKTSQSLLFYPTQSTTQYEYGCDFITQPCKEFLNNFRNFLDNGMDRFYDYLKVGSRIDLHCDDYIKVKSQPKSLVWERIPIKEYISIAPLQLPKGIGVSGLVWHPTLSATVAVIYSFLPSNTYRRQNTFEDATANATFNVAPILIWSFVDIMRPSLILNTPTEITCLAFCPYDENLLVAGCSSGQVILWDLKGKLAQAEAQEILTSDQQKYRILLQSLTVWIKNTRNVKVVRETVISDLSFSHKAPVSSIAWISPYHEITSCGRIFEIPEDQNRMGLQFITSGLDGNILVWDLNSKPVYNLNEFRGHSKSKRVKQRPEALTIDVSPYSVFNRIMRPVFRGMLMVPGTSRMLPITQLSYRKYPFIYEECFPNPNQKYSFFNRIEFKPILARSFSRESIKQEFVASSVEGDFVFATWDGFDVPSGERLPKELCKIKTFAKYHDGPIVNISRSSKFQDLILTVGGKVFAIWYIPFPEKPVIWRRSIERYTHGTWYSLCPSRVRLVRQDGFFELWDFVSLSHNFKVGLRISPYTLITSVTHIHKIQQNYFVLADIRGFCRIFLLSKFIAAVPEYVQQGTLKLSIRESQRKKQFQQWQEAWRIKHKKEVEFKSDLIHASEQIHEQQIRQRKMEYVDDKTKKKSEENLLDAPERGKYSEWAQKKFMMNEKIRSSKLLLKNKSLDLNVLQKQRMPLTNLEQQKLKKEHKQNQYLELAHTNFKSTVKIAFPETVEEPPPRSPDPYSYEDNAKSRMDIYESYQDVVQTCDRYVNRHPFQYKFNWQNVLHSGRERRKFLDGHYSRLVYHRRFIKKSENITKEFLPEKNIKTEESFINDTAPEFLESPLAT